MHLLKKIFKLKKKKYKKKYKKFYLKNTKNKKKK